MQQDEYQKRILHRLRISKGHLEKVIRMIESEEPCIDILHQSQAVQKALRQTDNLILECHLDSFSSATAPMTDIKAIMVDMLSLYKQK